MKKQFFLLLLAIATLLKAQDSNTVKKVISTSPDHRYEVVSLETGEWAVRDPHTKVLLSFPEGVDAPYNPDSAPTVIWSPDSAKVVLVYNVNKHGGDDYYVLAVEKTKLVRLTLPEDAIPIKWTGPNTLVCSVRIEKKLELDPKMGAFTLQNPASTQR